MALTPKLGSLEAAFRKLERELVRSFHERNPTHRADYFFNFCITAQSLRDYFFERLNKISPADQQPVNDAWALVPTIVAVSDIANTAKHFQLRDRKTKLPRAPRTIRVRRGRTTEAHVYTNANGEFQVVKRTGVPTYVVEVQGGKTYELYAFMAEVVDFWRAQLKSYGIKIRRQSLRQLHGT